MPNIENDPASRGLVPDDVIDADAYQQGARDAAEGIRSVANS